MSLSPINNLQNDGVQLSVTHQPQDSVVYFQIAIIGCGAAGVATLFGLKEFLTFDFSKNLKITIFEKGSAFGPGFAYQCDSNELLMNMVSATTSIFSEQENDFLNWMLEKGYRIGGDQVLSQSGIAPDGYIAREFFGMYLKSRLEDAISELERLGVEIELINLEVININLLDVNDFSVTLNNNQTKRFNCVILCVGTTSPKDIFSLQGKSHYINNPYPINRYSRLIKRSDSVGIIGGQLTAADIAVVLANQDHRGSIFFFTRDLNFPLIRCRKKNYELKYLTAEGLNCLRKKYRQRITIRQILRLARKDFLLAGIKWNKFFKASEIEYGAWIGALLENSEEFSSWQNLAIKTDAIIGDYWNALSLEEKDLFINRIHRLWAAKRVPLPAHTSLKLYSLIQLGILRHHPYLRRFDSSIRNQFTACVGEFGNPTTVTQVNCDWVINASGPSRDIDDADSPLINNLITSGLVVKNPHGGILLDYETSLIKDKQQKKIEDFYAIGHLTCGTYYFVSSLDMVSMRAKNVARHVICSLRLKRSSQDLNVQPPFEGVHVS